MAANDAAGQLGRSPSGLPWLRLVSVAVASCGSGLARPAVDLPAAGMNAGVMAQRRRIGGAGYMNMPVSRHFYTPQLIELPPRSAVANAGSGQLLVCCWQGIPAIAAVWLGVAR